MHPGNHKGQEGIKGRKGKPKRHWRATKKEEAQYIDFILFVLIVYSSIYKARKIKQNAEISTSKSIENDNTGP